MKTLTKKILTVCLTLAMACALAIPAFADFDHFRDATKMVSADTSGHHQAGYSFQLRPAPIDASRMERILFFPVRVLRNSCIASRKASSSASSHDSKW